MAIYNFQTIRGDSRLLSFTVTKQNGDVLNLTAAKIWMTAKYNFTDTDLQAVFQKTTDPGGGITIPQPTLGTVEIQIDPIDTSTLPAKNIILFFDVQIKTSDQQIFTILSGKMTIIPDVTISTT